MNFVPIQEDALPVNGQAMRHGADSALHVKFFARGEYDRLRSELEERDIFSETDIREFVSIGMPGGDTVVREATAQDKRRFSTQYRAFKTQEGQAQGIDVAELGLTRTQVQRLEVLNVFTVEQLAAVHEGVIAQMGPGGHDLVARAKRFLEKQPVDSSEIDALKAQNAEMQKLLLALSDQLKELKGKK